MKLASFSATLFFIQGVFAHFKGTVIMKNGQEIFSGGHGEFFYLDNDIYLKQRSDGKLVIRQGEVGGDSTLIWASNPDVHDYEGKFYTRLQNDCNIITRKGTDKDGESVWRSKTGSGRDNDCFFGLAEDMLTLEIWKGTQEYPKELLGEFATKFAGDITRWFQVGQDVDGTNSDDYFGASVALSKLGDVFAAGSPAWDTYRPGSVRVFQYNKMSSGGSWEQKGKVLVGEYNVGHDGYVGDWFGEAVDLSDDGTVLAVSAPLQNDIKNNTGRVYIYKYSTSSKLWKPFGNLLNGKGKEDRFGSALSLNSMGNIVAVGARQHYKKEGYLQVYQYNKKSKTWIQLGQKLIGGSDGDFFGFSADLSGDGHVLVVGAPYNSDNGRHSGYVHIYKYSTKSDSWAPHGHNSTFLFGGQDEWLGHSVSTSKKGDIIAVGAPYPYADGGISNKAQSGIVQIFRFDDDNNYWEQLGQAIEGENAYDTSGFSGSVSLSHDGMTVAIGSPTHYYRGTNVGNTRIFRYDSSKSSWVQISQNIDGETSHEGSDRSVSLNGAGTVVAIGAGYNDGDYVEEDTDDDRGHVRVFASPDTCMQ